MKQKVAKLIVCALVVIGLFMVTTSFAKANIITDDKGFVFDEDTGTIVDYKGTTNNVIIPETISDITVTAIGPHAFKFANGVIQIHIPKTIVTIDDTAFNDCVNLNAIEVDIDNTYFASEGGILYDKQKYVLYKYPLAYGATEFVVPHPVHTIAPYAFYHVDDLEKVYFPDSLTHIETYAFSGCKSLNNVTFSDFVTDLDAYAFESCVSFVEITLPAGIRSLSEGLFKDCLGLQEVHLSDDTLAIGSSSFMGCKDLSQISLPEGLTYIGDSAFKDNQALVSLDLPSSLNTMGPSAFMNCRTLETITYTGDALKQVPAYAFKGCESLKEVQIAYSLQKLSQEAFSDCSSLSYIELPFSVQVIEPYVFKDCNALSEVTIGKYAYDISEQAFPKTGLLKIITEAGTYAASYARDNHLPVLETTLYPYPYTHLGYAELLSSIDVFKGTANGYELDRQPTRIEGLVMLIRLLGKESTALGQASDPCPFTDVPDWAIGYVNFAYNNGLTLGIGNQLFGTNDLLDQKSYMTFLLRALNYTERIHFSWSDATNYAYEVGLTDLQLHDELVSEPFLRGQMAQASYAALLAPMNDSVLTLGEFLVNKRVIDRDLARDIGIIE